jgi:hypothetical protein
VQQVTSRVQHHLAQDVRVALQALAPDATSSSFTLSKGVIAMAEFESPHLRLQQQIDCQLEVMPKDVLSDWERQNWKEEPGTDVDEAPIKYMALILLDAIEERATRLSVDKDQGVTVYGETTYTLPKAPSHYIARGLEILREITGLEVPGGEGRLSLGVRDSNLELIVQKQGGQHMINIPGIGML